MAEKQDDALLIRIRGVFYADIPIHDMDKETAISKAEDKFLEYAEVYGNFYGTPIHKIEERLNRGEDVLLEIDIQGALNVMKKRPDGVYIFLLPPSLEELKNRIEGRGTESPETFERRFNAAKNEIATGKKYQYVVVNDEVDAAVEKIKAILSAERCKVNRNENLFEKLLDNTI